MFGVGACIAAVSTEVQLNGLNTTEHSVVSNSLGHNRLFFGTEVIMRLVFASTGVLVFIGTIALVVRICINKHHEAGKRAFFTCLVSIIHL